LKLHRYWFEFAKPIDKTYLIMGLGLGCGVTAYDLEDAMQVLQRHLFKVDIIPLIIKVIEDVDIPTLDQLHVITNMGIPIERGIWFPKGYE